MIDWPYTEGLRMDEAMHPLTLAHPRHVWRRLPAQNGAPVRVVVPWKYGFKSAEVAGEDPLRRETAGHCLGEVESVEYGFYSNVNPERDHPRWSQKCERRLGEDGLFTKRRPTLMFNGYAEQVASLYAGMDLMKLY